MTAKDKVDKALIPIIAGRTPDEQLECIRKYGNHSITPMLRRTLLSGLDIARIKPAAENLVIFGCYILFSMPLLIRDYLKLLDVLGIDHTYLEQEYCCGSPVRRSTTDTAQEQALQASREFMRLNRDLARQKEAKTIAYCCMGCAHTAKSFFPDEAGHHMYYFELLFDKIEQKSLSIAPTT
ncbi:MAG: (Fe-S)-binding protein, partial [Candidatus Omnitrophica bacterium]|nr:(Fe-S)-binding protein [Candidatus Omnitrophota bacterium]